MAIALGSAAKSANKMWPEKPQIIEIDEDEQQPEEISTSITQTWTDQAIKCYVTNADCANCTIPKGNYSFICQMDKVVPVLVKSLGKPDEKRVKKLLPYLGQY